MSTQDRPRRRFSIGGLVIGLLAGIGGLFVVLFVWYLIDTGGGPTPGSTASSYGSSYGTTYSPTTTTQAALPLAPYGTSQSIGDGLTARVEAPRPYRRTDAAAGLEGAQRLAAVTVTFTNNSSRYVNFAEVAYVEIYLDTAKTSQLFDTGNVGSIDSVALEPGASTTARFVCGTGTQPAQLGVAIQQLAYPSSTPPRLWAGRY